MQHFNFKQISCLGTANVFWSFVMRGERKHLYQRTLLQSVETLWYHSTYNLCPAVFQLMLVVSLLDVKTSLCLMIKASFFHQVTCSLILS